MTEAVIVAGQPLPLGKIIGRGGEGEVRALGDGQHVAKLYFKPDASREAKVRTMVALGLAKRAGLIAFPLDIATDRSGSFRGFTMRAVADHQPIHFLTAPKSRKVHFPTADYRFLVRVAANTARAIAEVHAMGCTVGDINHSGILVSSKATVSLIDADSFQLDVNGRLYPCLVGVPDYTPPELQGRSLAGVPRTVEHDHFGLAVTVFQLLFMGRHPCAGETSDAALSLEELIARNQFAFSRQRVTGSRPPKGVLTLDAFSDDMSSAFERAFGLSPTDRPTAAAWIGHLEKLERELSRCSTTPVHFFPSAAKTCSWCEIERQTGATLFLATSATTVRSPLGQTIDLDQSLAALKAMAIFDPATLLPPMQTVAATPSKEARAAKGSDQWRKALGWGGVAAAIALFFAFPPGFLFWLVGGGYALYLAKSGTAVNLFRQRHSSTQQRLQQAIAQWRQGLDTPKLTSMRAKIHAAIEELRTLDTARQRALDDVVKKSAERRLTTYLDQFFIPTAPKVALMTSAKVQRLASIGIETAADIDASKILAVHGFGPATTDALVRWRRECERGFNRHAPPTLADLQADAAATAKVEADFKAKHARLTSEIQGGLTELASALALYTARRSQRDLAVDRIIADLAQCEADLKHLGSSASAMPSPVAPVPLPMSAGGQPTFSVGTQHQVYNHTSSGKVTCPQCGAGMVRRTAKRSRRRGTKFWGCSRYPSCRGTRP
jgi:DNA-binding helix-hairpin-helix protein with protein kinase domain/predicted RNA-binding Zn-ribbon protein involved in translation (DUF1610 family)